MKDVPKKIKPNQKRHGEEKELLMQIMMAAACGDVQFLKT